MDCLASCWKLPCLALLLAAAPLAAASGEVVRLEISEREEIAGGEAFGESGPYERIAGTVHFEIDPANPANAGITDLALAPANERGRVEAHGNFEVLRPKRGGRGVALLEVSNRGGRASLAYFNAARRGDPYGDGLLMRLGLTVIWVGWQFDVPRQPGRLRLHVPVARAPDGSSIRGRVRCDWTVERAAERLALGHRGHVPYPVVDPDGTEHVLTERLGRLAPRRVVPRDAWRFTEDAAAIVRDGGFPAGTIHELVYRAEDPAVVGLGLAAIRDMIAFAKHDEACPFPVEHGVAVGISQTGRFLRHFLYQGFNRDEAGRRAFDGMLVHTAGAGRGSFNHRFAQPSRDAHRYSAFFYPTDVFPFSGRAQRDPVTGRREGLLDRARASGTVPRIFFTNTGYEYWGRAASLLHTSLDGSADVELLPEVRIYHLGATQHFPWRFPPPPPTRERSDGPILEAYRGNPIDFVVIERALLAALVDWVAAGVEPPPSAHPRIDDGTLVPIQELRFPELPGIDPPRVIHEAYRADYGPRFASRGIVDRQPPVLGAAFPSLVSQVDADGNEIAGIRPVEVAVPLATYAPWHVRRGLPGGNGELTDFFGTFVPFAATPDRERAGDPRASIAERYTSREAYLEAVERAARAAIDRRHLLPLDLPRVRARAASMWEFLVERSR